MTNARQRLGQRGEDLAARWYTDRGYTVLDRNWRSRQGELDLVAAAGDVIVFCEVKTRTSVRFGFPAEAVTYQKQRRIRGLAREWLEASNTRRRVIRFDVASVITGDGEPGIEVLPDAF